MQVLSVAGKADFSGMRVIKGTADFDLATLNEADFFGAKFDASSFHRATLAQAKNIQFCQLSICPRGLFPILSEPRDAPGVSEERGVAV